MSIIADLNVRGGASFRRLFTAPSAAAVNLTCSKEATFSFAVDVVCSITFVLVKLKISAS